MANSAEPRPLVLGAEWFPDEPGGLNRYVFDLIRALRDRGVSSRTVVVGPVSEPVPDVVAVPRHPLSSRLARYGRAARAQRSATDLVDTHFALYGLAAMMAGATRGRPLLVHFHGPWAQESSVEREAPAKVALKRRVERAVYRRGDLAVTLTGAFKRLLVERYGVAPWSVEVVPPAVDLELFSPGDRAAAKQSLGLPADGRLLVSVRRLVPRMGLETLLRAWAELGDARSGHRLELVGQGPQRESLEALSSSLGLTETVRFRGGVSEQELVDLYRAADASIVPSTQLEGFGLIVLESLACGTPVITSDAGGLPETTVGLPHRVVTPAGDVPRLAGALGGLLAGELPLPNADQCRAHAERYSREAFADAHVSIHRRLATPAEPRRPRVVFLDHTAELSGGELALLRTISALEGVDAHVVLAEEGPLELRLREAGISTEVLPLAEGARGLPREEVRLGAGRLAAPLAAGAYSIRLARRLRRLRPDLVHANSLKSGLYGVSAARMAGIPLVWHLRDRLATDYMPAQAARLARLATDRGATRVIANSEATKQTLGDRGRAKAVVIPSPVRLPAVPAEVRDRVRRVGVVGRLAPWKGQHVVLSAFARAFPDSDVTLSVIGAPLFGEDEYAIELERRAETLGISHRVDFRGFVDDVEAELARLDVMVHASVVPEPLGQVVLEGMAAGLPVIAADAGGPSEIVTDGVDGLLSPPGDKVALAERLERLASDRDLRSRLARAARRRAAAFAPGAVAERIERVYSEILEGGPDRS